MFQVLNQAGLAADRRLCESLLRDRAEQFVHRHGWPLAVSQEGFEIDEFDAPGTEYCVVSEDHRHVASVRLRCATGGSMAERHFPELWSATGRDLRRLHEVSRLCIAPRAAPVARDMALAELLIGLCRHCLRRDVPHFFGIIFPAVARSLRRAGWPPEIIGEHTRRGELLLLGIWEPSSRVDWNLQASLERRIALQERPRLQAA